MSDTFTTKLGTTRAGERTRIWIEGKRLSAAGFTCGKRFRRYWTLNGLQLETCGELEFAALPVAERGTVSGKGDKPIIDVTGELVRATFGKGSHVNVTYRRNVIVITRA